MENQKTPICVIAFAIINVVVFFLLSFGGKTEDGLYMLNHGAMYAPAFWMEKEYYRIFTSMFLHFGFEHLMNNMITFVVVGRILEPIVGKIKFVVIYVLSGVGGSLLSVLVEWYREDYAISAGASGAIFGLTGALLCLTLLNRGHVAGVTKWGMLIVIGLSLYNGFASEGVDNMAHIGGLITGLVVTFLLCIKRYAKRCTDPEF